MLQRLDVKHVYNARINNRVHFCDKCWKEFAFDMKLLYVVFKCKYSLQKHENYFYFYTYYIVPMQVLQGFKTYSEVFILVGSSQNKFVVK